MSLINDVLRDLEARGSPLPTLPASTSNDEPITSKPAHGGWVRPGWMAITVGLGLAVGWYGFGRLDTGTTTPPVRSSSEPPAANIGEIPPVSDTAPAVDGRVVERNLEASTPMPMGMAEVAAPAAMPPEVAAPAEMPTEISGPAATPSPPRVAAPNAPEAASVTESSDTVIDTPPAAMVTSSAAGAERPVPRTRVANRDDEDTALQSAVTDIAGGRLAEAEGNLLGLIERKPHAIRPRQMLSSLYQQQGRTEAAMAMLRTGLSYAPSDLGLAQSLARLLITANQHAEAAEVLAGVLPALPQDADAHALLAYALQQSGQYDAAAAHYRALVGHDPNQAQWWLGLAVAEDGRGDPTAALAAFRKALGIGGLEGAVIRYIEQRIQALGVDPP